MLPGIPNSYMWILTFGELWTFTKTYLCITSKLIKSMNLHSWRRGNITSWELAASGQCDSSLTFHLFNLLFTRETVMGCCGSSNLENTCFPSSLSISSLAQSPSALESEFCFFFYLPWSYRCVLEESCVVIWGRWLNRRRSWEQVYATGRKSHLEHAYYPDGDECWLLSKHENTARKYRRKKKISEWISKIKSVQKVMHNQQLQPTSKNHLGASEKGRLLW